MTAPSSQDCNITKIKVPNGRHLDMTTPSFGLGKANTTTD
ncbi:hypothetical protein CEV34_0012 [Brucella pseudogrignonensis]|uniref:Uncharacterized protein n=1 Tax=Brucella pseudogrignonensis TaxID=419475 RepID=A0A256GVR1_9HYPH|nr:hypothetical protein CEV34_0012 [Brucella pseudogrignonensis]